MKIPSCILEVIAGPILVATALGCSTSAPGAMPEARPVAPTEVAVAARAPVDRVSYDAAAETTRLARTADLLAEAELHRDARIEDEEAAESRRCARGTRVPGGGVPPWFGDIHPACGRG